VVIVAVTYDDCGNSDVDNNHCGEGDDNVRFEVLTAAVMNVDIFWDIVPCSLYVN
jgi:hypothetical protein